MSTRIRNITFFALGAVFAVLFPAATALLYLPGPVTLLLGIVFGLLGLVLVILTVRPKETGKRRLFFILTGASAAAIPPAAILHHFVFEAFFLVLALFVLPAVFVVGWLGGAVLLATAARPITAPRKIMLGLVFVLAAGAIVTTVMRVGGEDGYSVTSETVHALEERVERIFITANVAEPLWSVFSYSFVHSLISAFESNGLDAAIRMVSDDPAGAAETADGAELFAPDVTMHITIDPLYRTHRDGYEAIVGTVFEVSLTDATTQQEVWHLSGKVDYIADAFFKRPGYRAFDGIRKEFAWQTTAAIVRTFMIDVNRRPSAPIYTNTEERQRRGQRTD